MSLNSFCFGETVQKSVGNFVFFSICIIILLSGCGNLKTDKPTIHNGAIDLAGWDFKMNGAIPLEGGWEFYWHQLLGPDAFTTNTFANSNFANKKIILSVPSLWADQKKNHPEMAAHGFATYRLMLHNVPYQTPLSLRVNSKMGAYKIWVNGSLIYEKGAVETHRTSQTAAKPESVLIALKSSQTVNSGDMELVVQAAKYMFLNGGTDFSFFIGPSEPLEKQLEREHLLLIFAVTLLLGMGCYHLVFYFFRKQEKALLYFSINCLLWMWVLLTNDCNHWLMISLFPGWSMETILVSDYIAYFFSLPLYYFFLKAMFPDESNRFLPYVFIGVAIILTTWFSFDPSMRPMIIVIGHFVFLLMLSISLVIIFKAVTARRESAVLILSGTLFIALGAGNDILIGMGIIKNVPLASAGMLIFVCFQAVSLAARFAASFTVAENLGVQLKEKNIALSRLDSLKDEFIANTTHELCTPLSGIIGIAESMMAGATGKLPHQAIQNLDMMAASGRRLNGLVKNILDFSRLKTRDIHLNTNPIDIRGIVDIALKLMMPLAQAKDLRLVNNIKGGLPLVQADDNRLHQILFNLIGNALKYTLKGQVIVSATITGSHMEISIRDTGIGIPMESQDKVFRRFEQAHAQSPNNFGGTGLGLSITKHLVELHKGTIGFTSGRDRGTTFFFTLPLAIKGASEPSPPMESPLSRELTIQFPTTIPEPIQPRMATKDEKSMILVVDDDPINLQVAVNHLTTQGYEVLTAQSGEQALKMMPAGNKPDLVLLDIMMPQMDGYEVCTTLRETHSMSALPVIMLTARNQIQDMVKGFDTGANDYLTKPFSREELLARVHTQLKLKRAYKVLKENSRLKKEIERRKITELDLKMMQQRLARILDSLDEAIIAVNECFEICFSNTRCHVMMGYDSKKLLGQPAAKLFGKKDQDTAQFFNGIQNPIEILQKDGSFKPFHVAVTPLEIENETLQVLVIQQTPTDSLVPLPSHKKTTGLTVIEEINRSQQYMERLENTLSTQISRPTAGTENETKIPFQENRDVFSDTNVELKQEQNLQVVKVMTLALDLWVHETGTTKVDLAEQSGIWKVYMNKDGYERTQTFDKYLSIKKFPKFPRWPKVYMTVDFILLSCPGASHRKNALEIEYTHLKNLTLVFG